MDSKAIHFLGHLKPMPSSTSKVIIKPKTPFDDDENSQLRAGKESARWFEQWTMEMFRFCDSTSSFLSSAVRTVVSEITWEMN
jgi:hypothetical protein